MDGEGQGAAHPKDGAEGVGARAQVGDAAQEFEAVAFLLQRVVAVGLAEHLDRAGLQLPVLLAPRRGDQVAGYRQAGAGAESGDALEVVQLRAGHHLQRGEAAAVVELDEDNVLAATHRPRPPLDADPR